MRGSDSAPAAGRHHPGLTRHARVHPANVSADGRSSPARMPPSRNGRVARPPAPGLAPDPPPSGYAPPCAPAPAPRSAPTSRRCAPPAPCRPGGRSGPGTPITSDRGGTCMPSGITAPAATTLPVPTRTPLSRMLPIPIRHSSSTVQPWRITRCPTPTRRPIDARLSLVHVHDGTVLKVGLGADDDRRHVAAEYGPVPDAGVRAQGDVAHDGGAGGDEGGGMDPRRSLGRGREQHLGPGLDRRAVLERGMPASRSRRSCAPRARTRSRSTGGAGHVHRPSFGRHLDPEQRRPRAVGDLVRHGHERRVHRLGPLVEARAVGVVSGSRLAASGGAGDDRAPGAADPATRSARAAGVTSSDLARRARRSCPSRS